MPVTCIHRGRCIGTASGEGKPDRQIFECPKRDDKQNHCVEVPWPNEPFAVCDESCPLRQLPTVDEAKQAGEAAAAKLEETFGRGPDPGADCAFRLEVLRAEECQICGDVGKPMPIFGCALHGECAPFKYQRKGPKQRTLDCRHCLQDGKNIPPKAPTVDSRKKLVLRCHLSPGDIVMVTAAVRALQESHPNKFRIRMETSADFLFDNNPYVERELLPGADIQIVDMHYPLVHQSNVTPHHFIHGYVQDLEKQLGLRIRLDRFRGDIHLSDSERKQRPFGDSAHPYWILLAGGKHDFTAKWWDPARYQAVVDAFRGRILFVQCGEAGHWHPPLRGVVNVIGQTNGRDFVRLMHFAQGVVCPVTFAMHLAAAVETPEGSPPHRPCVVIAGGREPVQWEAYPFHQYLHTVGTLDCCVNGGCWKSRCQPVGDGDPKDYPSHLCSRPVQVSPELKIAQCMANVTVDDVVRAIEKYFEGGLFKYLDQAA